MKKNVLPLMLMLALFASCSSAYKTAQTPDDVYYSPGKVREYAKADDNNRSDRYSRRQTQQDDYEDYTASSDDNYLRMKIQNRYQWNSLDDYDYWYSPNYAYNNYYGFNSFNPYSFNSWGLSYGYSPFASIQPYGWFNSFYPSYGVGFGYSPYNSGFYGHGNGYGYYGYTPTTIIVNNSRNGVRTARPLLGAYINNSYNNYNNNTNNRNGRYVPANNGYNRYNNVNNGARLNNNNSAPARVSNSNSSFTPSRSYTPSSSGSSGGGGGGSRPVRH